MVRRQVMGGGEEQRSYGPCLQGGGPAGAEARSQLEVFVLLGQLHRQCNGVVVARAKLAVLAVGLGILA